MQLPPKIYAEAVIKSVSGESLLRSPLPVTRHNIDLFSTASDLRLAAASRLRAAGFEILDIGSISVNIAGTPDTYAQVFGASLEAIQHPITGSFGTSEVTTYINSVDESPVSEIDIDDTDWVNMLDGIAINIPTYYLQTPVLSATPPDTQARYLQVPNELAQALGATPAHAQGITGKGSRVVVIDSGCYCDHPFFNHHQYQLKTVLGPGSSELDKDHNGHGTGVAANVLAIAPDAEVIVLKADIALGDNTYRNINSAAAFRKAISLQPDIISCSWGSDLRSPDQLSSAHKVLAAAISEAVRRGIVVICAAGNGHHGFPAQHPDVIAAGGVYKHLEGSLKGCLEASNYASSFISKIYPGRRVPDVCGLVGQLPDAAYIMLPVSPNSGTDSFRSALGDETTAIDGWAAFSGTSSAAPQLAGVCALLKQTAPDLLPSQIKHILQKTAHNISQGNSNPSSGGAQARDGPDLATGHGLVVVHKALQATIQFAHSNNRLSHPPPSQGGSVTNIKGARKRNQNLSISVDRSINTMALDTATQRELHRRIDEIRVDLNTYLQKVLLSKSVTLSNLELSIDTSNFIEKHPQSEITTSLLSTLRQLVSNGEVGSTDSNPQMSHVARIATLAQGELKPDDEFNRLIERKHLFAAQSLLQQGRCQTLATSILLKAMALDGFRTVWRVAGSGEISEEDYYRLPKITSADGSITISDKMESKQGNQQISVGGEVIKVSELAGRSLLVREIDKSEIAALATKMLGEVNDISRISEGSPENFFACDCVAGRLICDGKYIDSCKESP